MPDAEEPALIFPKALDDGALIRVVAPSGPVPLERLERGIRRLRRELRADVVMADNLLEQDGYLAGPDALRLSELHKAFADPNAAAVYCARGGYGATRLLGNLDPSRLREHPKVIVGFSDITALLCWAYTRAGLPGIHGPVLTQLGTVSPSDMQRVTDLLEGNLPPPLEAAQGMVVHGGRVEGRLIAGNLEVLRSLLGTRFFPPLQDTILAFEEVAELPYRIDRTLTQLLASGALRGVRGIVVGQLIDCGTPDQLGPTAHEVVVERLGTLGIPLVTGMPFGHDRANNAALPFGTRVRLEADDCTLEFLEPVTRL